MASMKWGIRRKLHVIPIAVTVLLLAALLLMARVMKLHSDLTYGEIAEHRALADMHIVIQQRLNSHFGKFSVAMGVAMLDRHQASIGTTLSTLKQECSALLGDLDGLQRVAGLRDTAIRKLALGRTEMGRYCGHVNDAASAVTADNAVLHSYLVGAEASHREINAALDELRETRRNASNNAMAQLELLLRHGFVQIGGVLALAALLAIGMSLSISRIVARRLGRLAQMMTTLRNDPGAKLDLDVTATDEIGAIERGFSDMLGDVRAHQQRLAESAARLTEVNRELELQIHAKSQTEDALRDSKEFLQMAQSAGGIGIFELDLHTGLMRGSDVLFQLLGMPSGNGLITQEQWLAAVHPEDLEALIAQFSQAVSAGGQFHIEYRVLRPDSSVLWTSATGRVLLDGFGAARRVMGTVADVHRRKLVEEDLRRTAKSLAIAQKAGGIATFDVNLLTGKLLQSENMREILGLKPEDPLPKRAVWLELAHPEDRNQMEHPLRVPGTDGASYQREYRIIRADGSVRWLSERGVATHAASGQMARMAGAIIDITERKSSEAAMLELEARLERAVHGTPTRTTCGSPRVFWNFSAIQ
jgi:PAS domain S-box-containing protein